LNLGNTIKDDSAYCVNGEVVLPVRTAIDKARRAVICQLSERHAQIQDVGLSIIAPVVGVGKSVRKKRRGGKKHKTAKYPSDADASVQTAKSKGKSSGKPARSTPEKTLAVVATTGKPVKPGAKKPPPRRGSKPNALLPRGGSGPNGGGKPKAKPPPKDRG
jgi:hypothetical protein